MQATCCHKTLVENNKNESIDAQRPYFQVIIVLVPNILCTRDSQQIKLRVPEFLIGLNLIESHKILCPHS